MNRIICIAFGVTLALGSPGSSTTVRAEPSQSPVAVEPIEITMGKIGRYPMSSLLSKEWFFLGDKDLFIHVPGKTDMNQWLARLKGSLSVLAFPGAGYNPQATERAVRGEVIYSLMPSTNTHNFFIGDSGIALVITEVGKDTDTFQRKKELVDRLLEVAGKDVVLIFRQGIK